MGIEVAVGLGIAAGLGLSVGSGASLGVAILAGGIVAGATMGIEAISGKDPLTIGGGDKKGGPPSPQNAPGSPSPQTSLQAAQQTADSQRRAAILSGGVTQTSGGGLGAGMPGPSNVGSKKLIGE